MAGLVLSVIACALAGFEPDVGVIALVFGALLTLVVPAIGGPAFQRIDISPFSTTGATLIASAAEGDRLRLRQLLLRWGLSMIVAGPIVLVPLLAMAGW